MSEEWGAGKTIAVLIAALLAGAGLAGWRARGAAASRAKPEAKEEAFAAPVVRQRAVPMTARLMESFQTAPKPLPDTLFADPEEQGTAQFAQIASPLTDKDTCFRALGRPEGSYVRRRSDGWHVFEAQRWAPVKRDQVPEAIRRLYPDPDPQALRPERASRDGEVER